MKVLVNNSLYEMGRKEYRGRFKSCKPTNPMQHICG